MAPSPRARVAVVTGATSGIGRETARRLAALGWTTVVVGRGADRTARVAGEIAREAGNTQVDAVAIQDLALRSDAKELASALLSRYPEIHLLVNNAGAYFARRDVTPDGLERTFALNVLAPFLLTSLLADRLRVSAPSRVVNVASAAHLGTTLYLNDLQSASHFQGFAAYGRSKLALILLTREFARRLAGTGVTVDAVHPGFIRSGFGDNNPGGAGLGVRVAKFLFARSVGTGARTVVYVATDPDAAAITGEYFSGRRVGRASAASYDMTTARSLYDACRELSGAPDLPDPGPAGPSGAPPTTAGFVPAIP